MRALVLLTICATACARHHAAPDASTVDAVPRLVTTDQQTLLGGMLIEGSWLAGPSDAVGLELVTPTGTFDWDIHAHTGTGTQDVVSGFALTTVTYAFDPTQHAQWYLLLRNSSTDPITIEIRMELYGDAQWIGW
jgi:hypothetical protein